MKPLQRCCNPDSGRWAQGDPESASCKLKKRRVQRGDAPSNRTFGNCLLGIHCSQKHLPGSRVVVGFQARCGKITEKVIHRLFTTSASVWTSVLDGLRLSATSHTLSPTLCLWLPKQCPEACILDWTTGNHRKPRKHANAHSLLGPHHCSTRKRLESVAIPPYGKTRLSSQLTRSSVRRSRASGYSAHLQRRAGVFWRDEWA